jgi:hypothetical protein
MRIEILDAAEEDLQEGFRFYSMNRSPPVLDHIFLIPSILTLTHWHTLEEFTRLFSDTTANSPSDSLLPSITASLMMRLWYLPSSIAVKIQAGSEKD